MSDRRQDALDELLDDAARGMVDLPVPSDLRRRVRARIAVANSPAPRARGWRLAYAGMAAALALVAIGLVGRNRGPEPPTIALREPSPAGPPATMPSPQVVEPDRPRPRTQPHLVVPRRARVARAIPSLVEDLHVDPLALPRATVAPVDVAALPEEDALVIPPLSVPPAGSDPSLPFEEER